MNQCDITRVYLFDGTTVWADRNHSLFEVGNFLGGGAAGTVYECEHSKSRDHYALKILNPLGYKIIAPTLIRKCNIVFKGAAFTDNGKDTLEMPHIWWLTNGTNKQFIAAYFNEKLNSLRELSLSQCTQIWGNDPITVTDNEELDSRVNLQLINLPGGQRSYIPLIPPKYCDFVRRRARIFREITNMRKISNHTNVIKLESVLELIQESKCTIFLVMELANGGELFDRIKLDCGAREETAKFFFQQLLDGVKHCHDQGVCHRDLKPENLLLQDTPDSGTILKIADFGFSARFAMIESDVDELGSPDDFGKSPDHSQSFLSESLGLGTDEATRLRMLKSVVGSPFYVAPEVMQAQAQGYYGPKADVWSLGVILYAMLAGNLPFGQDLATCKRFKHFCKWINDQPAKATDLWNDAKIVYPDWLFPTKFSASARGLIVSMLHPEPDCRISVSQAMQHPLCVSAEALEKLRVLREAEALRQQTCVQHSEEQPLQQFQPVTSEENTMDADNERMDVCSDDSATGSRRAEVSFAPAVAVHFADDYSSMSNVYPSSNSSYDAEMVYDNAKNGELDMEDIGMFAMDSDDAAQPSNREDGHMALIDKEPARGIAERSNNTSPSMESIQDTNFKRNGTLHTPLGDESTLQLPLMSSPPFSAIRKFSMACSPGGTMPPLAPDDVPTGNNFVRDLLGSDDDDLHDPHAGHVPMMHKTNSTPIAMFPMTVGGGGGGSSCSKPPLRSSTMPITTPASVKPPAFSDLVKRSTRFITAVPASDVLLKVQTVLTECQELCTVTPIGIIGKVELHWDSFRLEVWGPGDCTGPALCALQLYQLPPASASSTPTTLSSHETSPVRMIIPVSNAISGVGGGGGSYSYLGSHVYAGLGDDQKRVGSPMCALGLGVIVPQQLYLVEFLRGQLDIFDFKRFYQWIRQRLQELVKKDYAFSLFDQSGSPMVDSVLLQRFQQQLS